MTQEGIERLRNNLQTTNLLEQSQSLAGRLRDDG